MKMRPAGNRNSQILRLLADRQNDDATVPKTGESPYQRKVRVLEIPGKIRSSNPERYRKNGIFKK